MNQEVIGSGHVNRKEKKSGRGVVREIEAVDVRSLANQGQIYTREVRSGQSRSDMQIRGKISVVDRNGQVKVLMGYAPGEF